ncbi:hypothetical protein BS78_K196900 [Paspalum vaginatum]|uniref:BAHD acyltransferase n=1 Tax=Paspalum vaginatum TaxID=158149 RepID=A0A9W7XEH9_9POAL|nr:hypothetical protein BS78_K196900 [Paspalum vaginatum]
MDNKNGVRRLSVSRVAPAPALAPENAKVKLSFLDVPWIATRPVQQAFLYEKAGGGDEEEFAAVVKRLRESLAAALALYLPLAGKLAYVEETRDVVVDCSDPRVAFFEAEAVAAGEMEVVSLVPELDARVLPAPVMTVQATRLIAGGGMALGVSALHAVVDGRGFVLFLDAWFSISRGGGSPVALPTMPDYARDAVSRVHPRGDELARHVLSKVAPNLPVAMITEGSSSKKSSRLWRQTIVLGADDIRRLKRRIDALASSSTNSKAAAAKPVSTFVALSALIWTAFVHAKGLAAGDDTHLLFQVDLRERLRPPVAAGYFGNCVRGCVASADAGELLGEAAGLLPGARAIVAALREVTAAAGPVAGIGAWVERVMGLPAARIVSVGGSPLFRLYQTPDFGLGMPDTVVPVYMPGSPETPGHGDDDDRVGSRVVLSGGRRDGDVHLSVSLRPVVLMDAFKKHIRSSTSTMIRPKF